MSNTEQGAAAKACSTAKLQELVDEYVIALKQTEGNMITLGRVAQTARDWCRDHHVSFVKFCDATGQPRRSVYRHMRVYESYVWLRDSGVEKKTIAALPAGSILQLNDLRQNDPEGADELLEQLKTGKAAVGKLEPGSNGEIDPEQLEKIQRELTAKWQAKVKAARTGASGATKALQGEVETLEAKLNDLRDQLRAADNDRQRLLDQVKQQAAGGAGDAVKELKKKLRDSDKRAKLITESRDATQSELQTFRDNMQQEVDTRVKQLEASELKGRVKSRLYVLLETLGDLEKLRTQLDADAFRAAVMGNRYITEDDGKKVCRRLVAFEKLLRQIIAAPTGTGPGEQTGAGTGEAKEAK